MRDLASSIAQGSGGMKKWGFIAMHAVAAAAFIFLLQRFGLNASLESSLLWALTFAVCAAGLAYKQTIR
jgi:hypothetical protein